MAYMQRSTFMVTLDVAEAIENGYGYEKTIERLRAEYGISDHNLTRIHELMTAHSYDKDSDYMMLAIDITSILEGDK